MHLAKDRGSAGKEKLPSKREGELGSGLTADFIGRISVCFT